MTEDHFTQWDDMNFWTSGEWDVVQERLGDLDAAKIIYNPARFNLFKALDETPYDKVRVMIVGQDPYPDPLQATGIAFSIPTGFSKFPPTLDNIFKEYCSDLKYPYPQFGDLTKWCHQGVLLWNAVPSCQMGKSLSHDWDEWKYLTREIIEKLTRKSVCFVFLGGTARQFAKDAKTDLTEVLEFSHPSPRGSLNSRNPFLGSRMFTTINAKLCGMGLSPIEWSL